MYEGTPFSLDGQTALITGGSRGIGFAIAGAFVDAGARVILTARGEDGVKSAAAALGANALGYGCDISDPEQISSTSETIWRLGGVDILVNNAGISPFYKRAEQVTVEDFDDITGVNLRGTFFMSIEIARRWFAEERRGRIINVTSTLGDRPGERLAVYGPLKAALNQLTRSLALEWADRGVRVNAIAPGWTESDFTADLFASRHGKRLLGEIPMGRWGVPSDMAGAALFLASEASAYTTGTVILVDGGRGLR